ncbi:MAG TPA: hypothetical protein VH370_21050 [Humisphaera sp.]|jgi:hypothetical protein|nr:hypothetical protein [Humisphaera sp.]
MIRAGDQPMPPSQADKNAVITRLLYDMCTLAASLAFLRSWQRKPKALDLQEEHLALNAALVKVRCLYDFFYQTTKTVNKKSAKKDPVDITADQILPLTLRAYTLEEADFRKSINKWCAHMTWDRIRSGTRPPTPKQAKRFGGQLLAHAKPFVADCLHRGFKLNKTGRIYWKRFNALSR